MGRRVLVVAYDFPPHGAIGTMRTLRVVQQLASDGWDVKVLTSDPAAFRQGTPVDDTLLRRVPPSVTVVRAAAFRGFERLKSLARRSRQGVGSPASSSLREADAGRGRRGIGRRVVDLVDSLLGIPDQESAWIVPAVVQGLLACRGWRPDVLYSSAPPWTGQLVARCLAGFVGSPWVADFRDPWARAPWREARPEFVRRANDILERAVIRRADAVLFVTRGNLDEFSSHYGAPARSRFHLVPNGCDPSEFEAIHDAVRSGRFVLLHAGTLYGARSPVPLIHAVARAIDRGALDRDGFRLRLLGPVNLPVDLSAESRRLGLDGVVELVPRVTRAESLREMVSASALLLVQPGTTVSVPGKAYEYLAAGRPVLALAEEGETADLVRTSGIGVSVQPDARIEEVEAALLRVVEIASGPYVRPMAALYDGRVHAVTAARLMRQIVESSRRGRRAGVTVASEPASGGFPLDGPRP
jgi:glycosyltransferase involved in cell wall biosynthesis